MFFETYSPEDVGELKTKVSLIENIYGFSATAQYEVTSDEKEIADWENKQTDNYKFLNCLDEKAII